MTGGTDRDGLFVVEGDGDVVEVTAYCVGCGEEVFNEHILRDTVEELDVEYPVHDRHECREKGKEVLDKIGSSDTDAAQDGDSDE